MAKKTVIEDLDERVRELEEALRDERRLKNAAEEARDDALIERDNARTKLGEHRDFVRASDARLPTILDACPNCANEPVRGVKRAFCAICKPVNELLELAGDL